MLILARSKRCLECKYCYQIKSDKRSKEDWRNNYTCDYMLATGDATADKGKDPDNCLLFERRDIDDKTGKELIRRKQLRFGSSLAPKV